jgi:hypothetical protein
VLYIIELEQDVWKATWSGDPGRTLHMDMAKLFYDKKDAIKELKKARKYRNFPDAKIVEVTLQVIGYKKE